MFEGNKNMLKFFIYFLHANPIMHPIMPKKFQNKYEKFVTNSSYE